MIRKALLSDAPALSQLAIRLWPGHTLAEMTAEFETLLQDPQCGVFLAVSQNMPVGFAQCQLRHDYVEGTETSPVGYLEGIYVVRSHRHQGIARRLLTACESWARDMGCREFASDCELTNTQSLAFHLRTGFSEANRIVCFTKKL